MKKITALAVLPLIALASCSESQKTSTIETKEISNNEASNDVNDQALNENISATVTDSTTAQSEKAFEFTYMIGDKNIPVKGKFLLKDGKVSSMTFDGIDENSKGPLADFAKNAPAQVIGKELKGLKIDVVSGASLTTAGFNEYLTTLN